MTAVQLTPKPRKVIEKFVIPGEEGYSEYWRRDKSPVEILELAKLLISIRKIMSYVGRNIGQVVWSGMQRIDGVSLDPTVVLGKYPIPAARADLAVGLAIQAAYQISEWSERFKTMALAQLDLPRIYAYKFDMFFDMAEKIYTDLLANRSVLGLYREKTREWYIRERLSEFINPPTVTELLHIWWKMAADRSGKGHLEEYVDRSVGGLTERTRLEKFYKKPIALLNTIVDRLRVECPRIAGVSERGNFRIELYKSVWPALLKFVKFWPGGRDDPFLLHDKFSEELQREEAERQAVKATIVSYALEIERALTRGAQDFTDQVRSFVQNKDEVVKIEGNDIVMLAPDKLDKKLLNNLRMVIQSISQRQVSYNRGLKSGKIDRRRLYRAATTGTVFLLKNTRYELLHDMVLLLDCTGSMSGPVKWDYAESIFQTLFTAIRFFNRNARAFAYNEVRGSCRLTEIVIGGRFYNVLPHGKTASGEAIIATALSLKKTPKRPFIIHITDGASNWGCGVKDAIAFCEKRRINLLTLGLGCSPSNKTALNAEYGQQVEFVDDLQDLPRLFRTLLNYSKWH